MSPCPLCQSLALSLFHRDRHRSYMRCGHCQLISVPDEFLLSAADEKAFYDRHQNNSDDQGYRRFLGRTWQPLSSRLTPQMQGLDFGCGPGPTISVMAAEQGLKMADYDLYYANRPELLEQQYDFITMTEVIEHVADAFALLQQLDSLLKPGAILAVMTKRALDEQAFINWHYKQDLTHIRFYSIATFEWIAAHFNWQLEVIDKDVVFFTRA
ncbi:class I SAM-dependent methyltransferase [Shewanella sp. AS1]|uniref:class I SAM-dependent methyltransferase n=1 Tax=Shewanella sp. AS1 TaxID=2907626 RepID=UPI001F198AA4|nr:class I SAM-dependent methyltransferase [Shewanella sp. AS1]MCE9680113.1 class I SAM-dependent methyltransferase [Shewanella sp. AS1]